MLFRDAKKTLRDLAATTKDAVVDLDDSDSLVVRCALQETEKVYLALWCSIARGKGSSSVFVRTHVGLWSKNSLATPDFQLDPDWLDELPAKHRANVLYLRLCGCHHFAYLQPDATFTDAPQIESHQIISWSKEQLSTWLQSKIEQAQRADYVLPSRERTLALMQRHLEGRGPRIGA